MKPECSLNALQEAAFIHHRNSSCQYSMITKIQATENVSFSHALPPFTFQVSTLLQFTISYFCHQSVKRALVQQCLP